MLAGADYVLMGAGIPRAIPGALDLFATGRPASLLIDVEGALSGEGHSATFDPQAFCKGEVPELKRPLFLGIVASATLAIALARKASGRVDGFVVEGPTAGGHNAPPRGPLHLTTTGEPLYGPRDVPELDKIARWGCPFGSRAVTAAQAGSPRPSNWEQPGFRSARPLPFAKNPGLNPTSNDKPSN
jgi:NAD(P)H-dependent flavin oxidoreductase YrpB (nitropropane dioxygenase family)